MKLTVRRYEQQDLAAVERFNARLIAAGEPHRLHAEAPEPPRTAVPVSARLIVALEGEELRGAVWLHEQDFQVAGQATRAGWLRLPLSESVINAEYRGVPASLIMQALRMQPRLMALGLGAHDTPIARLLAAFKWNGSHVPLAFSLVRPARVLRELTYARRDPRRRLLMDLAAWSGAGWLAGALLGGARTGRLAGYAEYEAEPVPQFGEWTDALWEGHRSEYALAGARDAATQNYLYLPDFYPDFHRLRVRRRGVDVGMSSVIIADFREREPDAYFGRLRVGLLADGFGAPGDAPGIVAAATQFLLERRVDLLISFQQHDAWRGALRGFGFRDGPSNFCWYRNPAIEGLLAAGGFGAGSCHVNRGDAEGPKWF